MIAVFLLFGILIRSLGINYIPVGDENWWIQNVRDILNGENTLYIPHPPLGLILYSLTVSVLGDSVFAFRIMPFIIGIILLYVVYKLTNEIYDRKTTTIAVMIASLLIYTVWNSLYIDIDGNILTLIFSIIFYSFIKYYKTDNNRYLFCTGILLGLSLLIKYISIIMIPLLIFWVFEKHHNIKKTHVLTVAVLPLLIFSIFPLLDYFIEHSALFIKTISWGSSQGLEKNIVKVLLSIGKQLFTFPQYATPLLAIIPLFFLKKLKYMDKPTKMLLSWFITFFVVYFFIGVKGNTQRYLSIVVPPMIIISSKYISDYVTKLKIGLKEIKYILLISITFAICLYYSNFFGINEIFSTQNLDLSLILKNPYIVYWGSVTTIFILRISTYLIPLFLTMFILIMFLKIKEKTDKTKKILFILLISVNIAYNAVILFESFYPTIGYAYTSETYNIIDYYKNSTHAVYTNSVKPYYFVTKGKIKDINNINEKNTSAFNFLLQNSLVKINRTTYYNISIAGYKCKLKKTFYSNNYEFAKNYFCTK